MSSTENTSSSEPQLPEEQQPPQQPVLEQHQPAPQEQEEQQQQQQPAAEEQEQTQQRPQQPPVVEEQAPPAASGDDKPFTPPPPRARHVNPEEFANHKPEVEGQQAVATEEAEAAPKQSEEEIAAEAAAAAALRAKEAEEAELKKQKEEAEARAAFEKQQTEERKAVQDDEEGARSSGFQAEEDREYAEFVEAEKSDRVNKLKAQLAKLEDATDVRRSQSAKLVTALGQIRATLAANQQRVNLTKQYADIALKCRHFDDWMNERYMSSPQLASRANRTGLISLEEMESMHQQRDEALDDLQRLADNLANLRELVMDADDLDENGNLKDEAKLQGGGRKQRNYNSDGGDQQQQCDETATNPGSHFDEHDTATNNGTVTSTPEKKKVQLDASVGGGGLDDDHHETTTHGGRSTILGRTSATSRIDEAHASERVLLMKLKELDDKKRHLLIEMSTREKKCEVDVEQFNRRSKAAAAGMSGMNKELFRLEEAVNAHFRVLRTSYASMKTEFPQAFEFDAFTQQGPPAGKKSNNKPAAIQENNGETSENNKNEVVAGSHNGSRRSSIHSDVNNPNRVGRIANVAANAVANEEEKKQKNKTTKPNAAAAASFAREASKLASPQMDDRLHRAADDMRKSKVDREKSTVDRAREDNTEERRSTRKIEKEREQSSLVSPKEQVRQKQVLEQSKMMSPKGFQRL